MTTLDDWRGLLADVEKATKPFDSSDAFPDMKGPAAELAGRVYPLYGHLWTDLVNALAGDLNAAVALIEREMPDYRIMTAKPWYENGKRLGPYGAELHHPLSSGGGPKWSAYAPSFALALFIAYVRARIAELEQKEAAA